MVSQPRDSPLSNKNQMSLAPLSRIPRPAGKPQKQPAFTRHEVTAPPPISRLELMKEQFKKRRQTISHMEPDQKQEQNGLRQYFHERRKVFKQGGHTTLSPNYKAPARHATMQKNSAGRDKSNPLTPLKLIKNSDQRINDDSSKIDGSVFSQKTVISKQNSQNYSKNSKNSYYNNFEKINNVQFNSDSENDAISNNRTINQKSKKPSGYSNTIHKEATVAASKPRKPSDFELWQQEQDANDERRRRQRAANPIAVAKRIDQQRFKSPSPQPPSPLPAATQHTWSPPPQPPSHRQPHPPNRSMERRKNTKITRKPIRRQVTPPSESNDDDNISEYEAATRAGYDEEAELMDRIKRGQEELEQLKQTKITKRNEDEKIRLKKLAKKRIQIVSRLSDYNERTAVENEEMNVLDEMENIDFPNPPVVKQAKKQVKKSRTHQSRASPSPPPPPPPPAPSTYDHVIPASLAPPNLPERVAYRPTANDNSEAVTFYADQAINNSDSQQSVDTECCELCGRNFTLDRLPRHRRICQKLVHKTRKTFDPSKMRQKGTDLEKFAKPPTPKDKEVKSNNWRRKHEEFMDSMKYARKVKAIEMTGGNIADLPPPPKSDTSHYKSCPHCSRKFDKDVAERHIPKCANMKHNKSTNKKSSTKSTNNRY